MIDEFKLKKKAAIISLLIGLGMFAAKMSAYFITGSAAIFSDAAESVVHVLATSMALYSILLSSKPADDSHLYGHGNVEYFSAAIEGILILIASLFIIYTATLDLIKGSELKQLNIGAIIITVAGVINLGLGSYLVKMGKKTNSLTLIADGKHVLTDSYTSIGVIVGIVFVIITGIQVLDPLFAIAVALNILYTGYKLVRESIGGLMHETDNEMLSRLIDKFNSIKEEYWIDIHWLRFWKSGDKVFIDFHLILPNYFTIKEAHLEEEKIEAELQKIIPNVQVTIHMDYCKDNYCRMCGYLGCGIRKDEFTVKHKWSKEKLIGEPIFLSVDKNEILPI